MSRLALTINNYTSDELKVFLRKDEKFQQSIRLYACYQVSLGKKPAEVAKMYQTTTKSIHNWINRLNIGGVESLSDKPRSGRPSQLDAHQRTNIRRIIVEKTPSDFHYNSAVWTGAILIDWLNKEYNIRYKRSQMYNILSSLGLTYQKSRGYYPESAGRAVQVEAVKKKSKQNEIKAV